MTFVCEQCGGRIEGTVPAYVYVSEDGKIVLSDLVLDGDAPWQCENGHRAPREQVRAIARVNAALTASGRPDGAGDLDLPLSPKP